MAKKKMFFVREYSKHVGATVMIVACILAFIFLVVGTPLGMLRERTGKGRCYTLWGLRKCSSPDYDWRVNFDTCTARRHRLQFGEAFSIVALFFTAITGIGSWFCIAGSNAKWVTAGLALFSIVANVVTWAVVANVYHVSFCGDDTLTSKNTKYAPGFALLVVGFAILCVGLICLIILE